MLYKSYVDYGNHGYEFLGKHNAENTIQMLDLLINDNHFKYIAVIEVNDKENWEFPVYVYYGKDEYKYYEFRDNLIDKENIKTLKKRRRV